MELPVSHRALVCGHTVRIRYLNKPLTRNAIRIGHQRVCLDLCERVEIRAYLRQPLLNIRMDAEVLLGFRPGVEADTALLPPSRRASRRGQPSGRSARCGDQPCALE